MTTPVTPTTSTTPATTASKGAMLGKDDFLKLLVGQLKNQDPMQPTDNQQWLSQMAQFTQLEQTSNMATSNEKILGALDTSRTLSLIGHQVSYKDSTGQLASGSVDRVEIDANANATLTIGGSAGIDAATVTEVR